jgi:hypothetical protein
MLCRTTCFNFLPNFLCIQQLNDRARCLEQLIYSSAIGSTVAMAQSHNQHALRLSASDSPTNHLASLGAPGVGLADFGQPSFAKCRAVIRDVICRSKIESHFSCQILSAIAKMKNNFCHHNSHKKTHILGFDSYFESEMLA